MKVNDNDYNLYGLMLVFIGMLIQFFGGILGGLLSVTAISEALTDYSNIVGVLSSTGSTGASLIAFIVIMVGLSKIQHYSPKLRDAKVFYLLELVATMILIVAIAMVTYGSSHKAGMDTTNQFKVQIIMGGIVLAVTFIALLIVNLLATRCIMYGCADIASDNDNKRLKKKCIKDWRLFLVSFLFTVAMVIVFAVMLTATALSSGSSVLHISSASSFVTGGIVFAITALLAALVFSVVMQIVVIYRVYNIYKTYNGETLPGKKIVIHERRYPIPEATVINEIVGFEQPHTPETIVIKEGAAD